MAIFENGRLLFLLLAVACCLSAAAAASPHALLEEDKKFAARILTEAEGSVSSVEEKYQILRSFEVLGIRREDVITCGEVKEVLTLSNSLEKDAFYASKIAEALQCQFSVTELKVTASNLLSSLSSKDALLDLRFSIGTLAILKSWIKDELNLENPVSIFHKIKALGEEDGTWKYVVNDDGTSARAAGLALEALADLIKLASPAIDEAKIRYIRGAASKLFESLERYEDGTLFFGEKSVDGLHGGGGPLAATSCVVKGVAAIASVTSGQLEIPAEKIVGIANYFLSAGVQGSHVDLFHVLDALGALDRNSFLVPLILSVHSTVLSLTANDILKISTTTVLGSPVAAAVTLRKAVRATEKSPFLSNQILESDDKVSHRFDLIHNKVDIGTYDLTLKVKPLEEGIYAVDSISTRRVLVTGVASIAEVEVGVLDSDTGSADFMKRWDPSSKEVVSLFATHLQKLRFSLDVLSPFKASFRPHQVFVKLKHESNVEHLFLLKPSRKTLELSLDLLGLVEKLKYLSGVYTIELIIGDAAMENPVIWSLGTVELDLPEPSEGMATKPSFLTQAPSKYGPKPEITHMFRPADKRAPSTVSNTFLILSLLPLLGFLVGLKLLNTNLKSFPSSGLPVFAAVVFHVGIASILGLYVLFWLKFNLFQTLKLLGVLGTLLTVPGYYILSHLADSSAPKIKSA